MELQANRVDEAITRQLETLATRDVAEIAVSKGISVVCSSVQEAASVSDVFAPEHLEVQTKDSPEVATLVNSYGGLFIGKHTAEVFGDYGAGPNHVLPTGGTGRYTGGLSVFTFLRVRTWMRSDEDTSGESLAEYEALIDDTAALARLEGLRGHERAALERRSK